MPEGTVEIIDPIPAFATGRDVRNRFGLRRLRFHWCLISIPS